MIISRVWSAHPEVQPAIAMPPVGSGPFSLITLLVRSRGGCRRPGPAPTSMFARTTPRSTSTRSGPGSAAASAGSRLAAVPPARSCRPRSHRSYCSSKPVGGRWVGRGRGEEAEVRVEPDVRAVADRLLEPRAPSKGVGARAAWWPHRAPEGLRDISASRSSGMRSGFDVVPMSKRTESRSRVGRLTIPGRGLRGANTSASSHRTPACATCRETARSPSRASRPAAARDPVPRSPVDVAPSDHCTGSSLGVSSAACRRGRSSGSSPAARDAAWLPPAARSEVGRAGRRIVRRDHGDATLEELDRFVCSGNTRATAQRLEPLCLLQIGRRLDVLPARSTQVRGGHLEPSGNARRTARTTRWSGATSRLVGSASRSVVGGDDGGDGGQQVGVGDDRCVMAP